jgi:hypothetical protein
MILNTIEIENELAKYDVELLNESFFNNKNKIHTISLFEEIPATYGVEMFKALLPQTIKVGKLFKVKDSSNEPLNSLLLLKQFSNVAFIPLVTTSNEVMEETILLFGKKLYNRMMMNYIFPRVFRYKNPYLPGSKMILQRSDVSKYIEETKAYLPKLINTPSFVIKNIKNSIIDLSSIITHTMPSRAILMRPNVLLIADSLSLQMVSRLGFKNSPEDQPFFSALKTTMPPIGEVYNSLIFSIKVMGTDIRIANQYLNISEDKIPVQIKKNPDSIFVLGLVRFLLKLIDNRPMTSSLEQSLATHINRKDHVIFLFHNDTHGFYIDVNEIKEREIKFNAIFRLIKYSLKTLIALNNKEISPLDVNTETELSPEDEEKALDEKIQANNKVIDNAITEIAKNDISDNINDKTNQLLNLVNDEENKTAMIKKGIAQGQANMKLQKKLGLNTAEKNKKIDTIDYGQLATFEDLPKNKAAHTNDSDDDIIDKFLEEINHEKEEAETEENEEQQYDEEEEAKGFLEDLADENDEENQRKLIEQIKASTTPPLTAAEKRRLEALHNKYKSIRYDDNRNLEEILADTEALSIDINKSQVDIKDDSFNYSLLKDFTKSYVNKMMGRDIVKTVKFFSDNKSLNMHITSFKKNDISDQFNSLSLYTFDLEDDNKQKHKIKFKLPNIDDDGFIYINGNRKFLKKQFILRPVTKTKEDEVYLTSDYNKVRLYRQGTVLNRNTNIIKKIINTIISDIKDNPNGKLSKDIYILRGNNALINSNYITTIEYDELASFLHHIILHPGTVNEVNFYFNQSNIREEISKRGINYNFAPANTPIGIDADNTVIEVNSIDSTDSVAIKLLSYIIKADIIPDIQTIINNSKTPKRRMYSRLELQSKDVPLIIYLSAIFNYSKVIEVAGIKTYFVKNKEEAPPDINFDEMVNVVFADGILYYDQYPIENALLLNGLSDLYTQMLNYAELDNLATYIDWIYDTYKTRNIYYGWTAFKELFLNPKTIECLESLRLPTDFLELFLYANSLLANNSYLNSADARNWRMRDYEMFNAILYDTISHAYSTYKRKGKHREGFSISEEEVLKQINKSFVTANYDSTNPLNELRERSSITYKGPKGINQNRAFTLDKRGQTRSTVGTIGISSIDKGNVGIVKQLTINPRIINTLGFIDSPETDSDVKKIPTSSLMTAEESMLPFVNCDDPKRIGFASGQTKHVIPAEHFTPQVIGTGFEQSIIYKIGDDFGYKAKKDGQILAIHHDDKFVIIKYQDGTTARVDYGERYHRNSDFFLSNNLELAVKEGDLIKKGELITYNKDFFKKHMGRLMYSQGIVSRIAITEGEVTEEDSSAISQRLANKLNSTVIKRKQIVLGVNSNIIRSVERGEHVIYGDPLLVFEDQKDNESDISLLSILGESNEKVLDSISRHKSTSDYTGEVIDIKMYWTVPPELMSESCAVFVKKYIRSLNKQIQFEEKVANTRSRKKIETQVSVPIRDRINGMELPRDGGILVEYFIKHSSGKRGGDKLTVNSSLKTIICQVFPDNLAPRRLQGRFRQIDMIFSFIGVNARMVSSVWFSGFTAKIIVEQGKKFAEEFFSELGEDPKSISESALVPLTS